MGFLFRLVLAAACGAVAADWMLHTPGGGPIDSRCPCLPAAFCPRRFGQSAHDARFFGHLPVCADSRRVRCCGVSFSVAVSRRKIPPRADQRSQLNVVDDRAPGEQVRHNPLELKRQSELPSRPHTESDRSVTEPGGHLLHEETVLQTEQSNGSDDTTDAPSDMEVTTLDVPLTTVMSCEQLTQGTESESQGSTTESIPVVTTPQNFDVMLVFPDKGALPKQTDVVVVYPVNSPCAIFYNDSVGHEVMRQDTLSSASAGDGTYTESVEVTTLEVTSESPAQLGSTTSFDDVTDRLGSTETPILPDKFNASYNLGSEDEETGVKNLNRTERLSQYSGDLESDEESRQQLARSQRVPRPTLEAESTTEPKRQAWYPRRNLFGQRISPDDRSNKSRASAANRTRLTLQELFARRAEGVKVPSVKAPEKVQGKDNEVVARRTDYIKLRPSLRVSSKTIPIDRPNMDKPEAPDSTEFFETTRDNVNSTEVESEHASGSNALTPIEITERPAVLTDESSSAIEAEVAFSGTLEKRQHSSRMVQKDPQNLAARRKEWSRLLEFKASRNNSSGRSNNLRRRPHNSFRSVGTSSETGDTSEGKMKESVENSTVIEPSVDINVRAKMGYDNAEELMSVAGNNARGREVNKEDRKPSSLYGRRKFHRILRPHKLTPSEENSTSVHNEKNDNQVGEFRLKANITHNGSDRLKVENPRSFTKSSFINRIRNRTRSQISSRKEKNHQIVGSVSIDTMDSTDQYNNNDGKKPQEQISSVSRKPTGSPSKNYATTRHNITHLARKFSKNISVNPGSNGTSNFTVQSKSAEEHSQLKPKLEEKKVMRFSHRHGMHEEMVINSSGVSTPLASVTGGPGVLEETLSQENKQATLRDQRATFRPPERTEGGFVPMFAPDWQMGQSLYKDAQSPMTFSLSLRSESPNKDRFAFLREKSKEQYYSSRSTDFPHTDESDDIHKVSIHTGQKLRDSSLPTLQRLTVLRNRASPWPAAPGLVAVREQNDHERRKGYGHSVGIELRKDFTKSPGQLHTGSYGRVATHQEQEPSSDTNRNPFTQRLQLPRYTLQQVLANGERSSQTSTQHLTSKLHLQRPTVQEHPLKKMANLTAMRRRSEDIPEIYQQFQRQIFHLAKEQKQLQTHPQAVRENKLQHQELDGHVAGQNEFREHRIKSTDDSPNQLLASEIPQSLAEYYRQLQAYYTQQLRYYDHLQHLFASTDSG